MAAARRKVSDEECVVAYSKCGQLGQAAAELGINKSSLHARLVRLGVSTARARRWSAKDDARLRAVYEQYRRTGQVRKLAELLDRTTGAVTTRAYALGLTDPCLGEENAWVPTDSYYQKKDERYRTGELLLALGALDNRIDLLVLGGDPMSKARSRFTKRGFSYTPPSVSAAESRWVDRLAGVEPYTGNVAVAATFVRADHQRIDADNMLKLVLDGCTKAGIWKDDSQVTAVAGKVELDPYEPRTILALAPHQSTMQRGTDHWPICGTCEQKFNPAGRTRPKFCSKVCRDQRPSPKLNVNLEQTKLE